MIKFDEISQKNKLNITKDKETCLTFIREEIAHIENKHLLIEQLEMIKKFAYKNQNYEVASFIRDYQQSVKEIDSICKLGEGFLPGGHCIVPEPKPNGKFNICQSHGFIINMDSECIKSEGAELLMDELFFTPAELICKVKSISEISTKLSASTCVTATVQNLVDDLNKVVDKWVKNNVEFTAVSEFNSLNKGRKKVDNYIEFKIKESPKSVIQLKKNNDGSSTHIGPETFKD